MGDEATIEDEELERQRVLRSTQRKDAAAKSEQVSADEPSEEERGRETAALNSMTVFDIAGDLFGWVPFLGGIVRFIAGAGAVFQSFKLNIAVRAKAWVINGALALVEIALSVFGLNELPLQTFGAIIIRIIASNAAQEKTKQPE